MKQVLTGLFLVVASGQFSNAFAEERPDYMGVSQSRVRRLVLVITIF